jgi:hypothetical protein
MRTPGTWTRRQAQAAVEWACAHDEVVCLGDVSAKVWDTEPPKSGGTYNYRNGVIWYSPPGMKPTQVMAEIKRQEREMEAGE